MLSCVQFCALRRRLRGRSNMALTKRATSLACLTILASGLAANAATVTREGGSVFVNDGAGFVKIAAAKEVNASSQIMVSPGGIASLAYASNCEVQLPEGIWRVQASPPCAAGVSRIDFTGRMNADLGKDCRDQRQQHEDDPECPAAWQPGVEEPDHDRTLLIVGGLAVAGGVTAAILLSQDDDDPPPPGGDTPGTAMAIPVAKIRQALERGFQLAYLCRTPASSQRPVPRFGRTIRLGGSELSGAFGA